MLRIFYGRENLNKEKFLFDNIEGRALIIVPDQFTLEMEESLFSHLKVEAIMDIEVLPLSRLGDRVVSELGGSKRVFIDKYGRHMLLSKILKEEKESLKAFSGLEEKSSFVEMVSGFISEMKKYDVKSLQLEEASKSLEENSYSKKKLDDLSLIYEKYQKYIQGKYTDSDDYIDLFLDKIKESKYVRDNKIWFYGFDSYVPKTIRIIGEMLQSAKEVNIVLTYSQNNTRDRDLFSLSKIVMEKLMLCAENVGASCECIQISSDYMREDMPMAIRHLERELYSMPFKHAEEKIKEGISLVAAANLYSEAETAACHVLHLVRDKGYRYKDIRLVCNDQDTRGPIIQRVFKEYDIEVFSDSSKDIVENPICQLIVSLVGGVLERYRTDLIVKGLKSGFLNLGADEIEDLESYAIKYKIRGNMWKSPFVRGEREYGIDGLETLNLLREKAIKPFVQLEEVFSEKSLDKFIEGFIRHLEDNIKIEEKIQILMEEQISQSREDLAQETAQVFEKTMDILVQMKEILKGEAFNGKDFLKLFTVGISQVTVGVIPPTKDGLMMGTMQRSRLPSIKALLILGANEGILPQRPSTAGLFANDEKELFVQNGVELGKVESVKSMEEKLAIYRNMCQPAEELWISYSNSDIEGKTIRPSMIFNRIKELFPGIAIKQDVISENNHLELITGTMAGLRHFTGAIQDTAESIPLSLQWQQALNWYQKNKPQRLNPIREGIGFTNRNEALKREIVDKLYKNSPLDELVLSPTRIERFSRCPFSYFINYGLKPEERRIFEVAPREVGEVYHSCLMFLSKTLTQEGVEVTSPNSPWMTIEKEECDDIVEKIIRKEQREYAEGLFESGNGETYRIERIIEISKKLCWTVVQQVRKGLITESMFEASFKKNGQLSAIEIEVGEEKLYIEGKIDRVDYLENGRIRIIDYKTGKDSVSFEEIEKGYRLQLMIYLKAASQEDRIPAGVFYLNISQPMSDYTKKAISENELLADIRKTFKLSGLVVDDEASIKSMAGEFSGFSDILPVRYSKDGYKGTGKGNLISQEDFKKLQAAVDEKLEELCKSLLKGNIDISPMKTGKTSACEHCQYKGICRFDLVFEGCKYNII